MAMDIKLFVSNCYLCESTKRMVKKIIGPKCSLRIYNLAEKKGQPEAKKYKIRTVPTIVGNGQKMFEGVPEYEELVKCSLEHGCQSRLLK